MSEFDLFYDPAFDFDNNGKLDFFETMSMFDCWDNFRKHSQRRSDSLSSGDIFSDSGDIFGSDDSSSDSWDSF